MAKREIRARTAEELSKTYPIADRLPDWFFRVVEVSNSAWQVEGCDRWGRTVSRAGGDPDALLEACIADARTIAAEHSRPSVNPDSKAACAICDQYAHHIAISGPEQLRRIVGTAQAAVAERTLQPVEAEAQLLEPPDFATLDLSETLPDVLAYRFACTACGRAFELTCECYHGTGGHWRPA